MTAELDTITNKKQSAWRKLTTAWLQEVCFSYGARVVDDLETQTSKKNVSQSEFALGMFL